MEQTGCGWRRGEGWMKDGEEIKPRTSMRESWTWTTTWGATEGGEQVGLGGGGQREKKREQL